MTFRIRHAVCLSAVLMVLASGPLVPAQTAHDPTAPSADAQSDRTRASRIPDVNDHISSQPSRVQRGEPCTRA